MAGAVDGRIQLPGACARCIFGRIIDVLVVAKDEKLACRTEMLLVWIFGELMLPFSLVAFIFIAYVRPYLREKKEMLCVGS